MAIIKTRPKLKVSFVRDVRPGDTFEVDVHLEMRKAVPVEFIRVFLHGKESTSFSNGNNSSTYHHSLIDEGRQVQGEGELPVGHKNFSSTFALPDSLLPSFKGKACSIEYCIVVHISIPWWPDLKYEYALHVSPATAREHDSGSLLSASRGGGPEADEPYIELRLDSPEVQPGATLRGAVALSNVHTNDYQAIELAAVQLTHARRHAGVSWRERERQAWTIRLEASRLSEGETHPFAMTLPPDGATSFEGTLVSLDWVFEATAITGMFRANARARAAFAVFPPPRRGEPQRQSARHRALPTIGADRSSRVWSQVATELGLELVQGSIVGSRGALELRIEREHRGGGGIFLVARLSYPSLGLELDGGVKTGFRRLIGGGVLTGKTSWDRAHYLTSREPAQLEPFVSSLAPVLSACRVADMHDTECVLERRNAGVRRAALQQFSDRALALASAFEAARKEIPTPASFTPHEDAWRRAARALHGILQRGSMRIDGQLDGAGACVSTIWNPGPEVSKTEATLAFETPTEPLYQVQFSEGVWSGQRAQLPGKARHIIECFAENFAHVAIEKHQLTLAVRGMVPDPKGLISELQRAVPLERALIGERGPYR